MLRLANIEDWETSKYTGRRLRERQSQNKSVPEVFVRCVIWLLVIYIYIMCAFVFHLKWCKGEDFKTVVI